MLIDGVEIKCANGMMDEKELTAYVRRGKEKYGAALTAMTVTVCEDDENDVEIEYDFKQKFNRLRRITGYLVGDLSRWNDGKAAEQADRVKHTV